MICAPLPLHAGPSHVNKSEASYAPVSYLGPPSENTSHLNHGRSLPPRTLNYRHPMPILRPPLENERVNGGLYLANFFCCSLQ